MGYTTAQGIASSDITLEQQLAWHLRGNHFPPVPETMVQPCIEAIEAGNDEDFDREIALPEGILWRDKTTAPAYAIIEGHHLQAWIASVDDYYEEEED